VAESKYIKISTVDNFRDYRAVLTYKKEKAPPKFYEEV
jgi:hypothetical protein